MLQERLAFTDTDDSYRVATTATSYVHDPPPEARAAALWQPDTIQFWADSVAGLRFALTEQASCPWDRGRWLAAIDSSVSFRYVNPGRHAQGMPASCDYLGDAGLQLGPAMTRLRKYGADLQRSELEKLYRIDNAPEVWRFLQDHRDLLEIVLDARPAMAAHFGPMASARLKIVKGRQADEPDRLFAYILTELSPSDALSRLRQVDEAWLYSQRDRIADRFQISLRYA